jgi:hypothetical protein
MKFLAIPLLLTSIALAANPQDEQVVRNAYAKLAYAAQSKIVYTEAQKNPNLKSPELARKLQDNELRFEITEMSSGALSDIDSRPYSDFVTRPQKEDVLQITHDTETFDENGKRFTSYFAIPHWGPSSQSQEDWDTPVKEVIVQSGNEGKYFHYVTATITVRFQARSRTYHALWLFGSDILAVDLVTGNSIVRDFATQSAYPSLLTDSRLRSHPAVSDWLNSTQRFDASCKKGKQDVCCDTAAMRCGVNSEDLRSTEPAPNTKAARKEGL